MTFVTLPTSDPTRLPQIAKVLIDRDVAHLDRNFDYEIPSELLGKVGVGSRVQVIFGRKRSSGWVTAVTTTSDFQGRLAQVQKLLIPVPLFGPSLLKTAEYLALRFGTNLSQVLTFITPQRRANVDKEFMGQDVSVNPDREDRRRRTPRRSVHTVVPGGLLPLLTNAIIEQKAAGMSTLVITPDATSSQQVAALLNAAKVGRVGHFNAQTSAESRYRTYLESLTGNYDVVVGTRSAVWLNLPELGGIIVWDSGDDRLRERRSPQLDVLDVAVARSYHENVDLLSAAYGRSVKAQALVESGWAQQIVPDRSQVLERTAKTKFFDHFAQDEEGPSGWTILPNAAYRTVRKGLESGSVLIQVASSGYWTEVESTSAKDSDEPTRWRKGAERIAEELQRAFPEATVVASTSTAEVVKEVAPQDVIAVATPGAEPSVQGGYSAVIIAQSHAAAYRDSLDAPVEALRRWLNALALARPQGAGLIIGTVPPEMVDAVASWRPERVSHSAWKERFQLGFPPAWHVVEIVGAEKSMRKLEGRLSGQAEELEMSYLGEAEVIGNEDKYGADPAQWRLLSVPPAHALRLMSVVRQVRLELSERRLPHLRVVVNPSRLAPPDDANS